MALTSKEYHQITSYRRNKMPWHFLDWQNKPSTFKTYPNTNLISLPRDVRHENERLSEIIKFSSKKDTARVLNIEDVSKIFALTYTITSKSPHGEGYHYYRSVASAGALYPAEIYVATRDINGIGDGLYHFSIAHHALLPLRKGDVSEFVLGALHGTPRQNSSLNFFFSAIFFRNSWKYRERSYRYHLLDTGHLIENLVLSLNAQKLLFELSFDFDDHALNKLLGFDETKEVCLAVCQVTGLHLGKEKGEQNNIAELADSIKGASRVSRKEIEYLAIRDIHNAGALKKCPQRGDFQPNDLVDTAFKETIELCWPDIWPEQINYKDAFFLRRSRRNFIPKQLSKNYFMALLECLTLNGPCDYSDLGQNMRFPGLGLIVGNVDGFEQGFYLMDESKRNLKLVNRGSFAGLMAHICLDQNWLATAAIHFLFVADLDKLDDYCGPRGYRYVMMNSGRIGQRLYLAATAMGLGCCGIGAFYDTEAAQLLNLKGESRLLYLIAVGMVKSPKGPRH